MSAVEVYAAVRHFVMIEENSQRDAARVFGLICSDGTGTSRSAIHAVLVDRVEAAFREGLGWADR